MLDEKRHQHIEKLTEKFLLEVSEYADAVQVMITYDNPNHSQAAFCGNGNWHARRGLAQEFIERDKARTYFEIKATEYDEDC